MAGAFAEASAFHQAPPELGDVACVATCRWDGLDPRPAISTPTSSVTARRIAARSSSPSDTVRAPAALGFLSTVIRVAPFSPCSILSRRVNNRYTHNATTLMLTI